MTVGFAICHRTSCHFVSEAEALRALGAEPVVADFKKLDDGFALTKRLRTEKNAIRNLLIAQCAPSR